MQQNHRNEMIIELADITKSFPAAKGNYNAFSNVSLKIVRGQMVGLTGKSGSGKSTLLNIIAGIDSPTQGSVRVTGVDVNSLSESNLSAWRGKNIGVIFQFFHLIPTLTIVENVMLPMDFCGTYSKNERIDRAHSLLDMVSICDQADKLPSTLSGGQQQRASIARALANDPPIVLADEPTGNLDPHNAKVIFNLLTQLRLSGKTIVVATHEKEFSKYFQKSMVITDGAILNPSESQGIHGGKS